MTEVHLNSKQRDDLINVIDRIKEKAVLMGATPSGSEEESLALKQSRLHYDRMLDILYPGTAPLSPIVPIESLAPSPGEARELPQLERSRTDGP